jgi:predicted ArsR family transcriptional regulator
MTQRIDKRFWESTRGRIVLLLQRGSQTVNELAEALGVTDNAVRAQLVALERDGLVGASGTKPGVRKPNVLYDLTTEAGELFPKVYGPMLHHLLDVLQERTTPKKLQEIMRTVGQRMAAESRPRPQAGRPRNSVEQAIALLHELGGFCESQGSNGKTLLQCSDCPLAMVAVGHPEVCVLIETLLSEALGVPVRQQCQAEPSPRCRFEMNGNA